MIRRGLSASLFIYFRFSPSRSAAQCMTTNVRVSQRRVALQFTRTSADMTKSALQATSRSAQR